MNDDIRIYVASLADYNSGRLHGVWIDVYDTSTVDEILEEIDAMLKESTEPVAEEYAIHDYECPISISEYEDMDTIIRIAEVVDKYSTEAVKAAAECISADINDIESALDSGYALYKDTDEAVDEFLESIECPDSLICYIDYDAVWRDLQMDGYSELEDGSVAHFYG